MTQDEIMKMAREAGLHIATDVNWMPIISLEYAERFAALVIANHPPQSYMTWQEGYEAGKHDEREACAKVCEDDCGNGALNLAEAIRARGQA
jgi:hypothetical protein